MGLFGSGKCGNTHNVKVTFTSTSDGGTTLVVNGVPYGTITPGKTPDEDFILVNSSLSEQQRAEALVGLMGVVLMTGFGYDPSCIRKPVSSSKVLYKPFRADQLFQALQAALIGVSQNGGDKAC